MTAVPPIMTGRIARWPQGVTLAAQAVLPTMGSLLLVPVLPMIGAEYGGMPGSAYWIPAMLTVPALCIALFSPLAGLIGDRFGRRTPLIAALSIYGLAGLAPLMLDGFAAIFVTRVLLGLCEAIIITLSATMIGDYFTGQKRDRLLALVSTFASLSAIVFLGMSGVLGAAFGWRGPTMVYGLALLFLPAMLLLTWEPARATATSEEPLAADETPFPWRHIGIVAATTLFGSIFFYVLAMQTALALAAIGVTEPQRIGFFSAVASIGVPIGTLVFWRVSHWRPSLLIGVELTIIGLACVAVSRSGTDWHVAAAGFCGLFGCGLLLPTLITWTMRRLSFRTRGRGTGIFQSMFALGQFASGVVMPFLTINVTGGILPSFGALGGVAFGVGAIVLVLAATLRRMTPTGFGEAVHD